MMTPGLGDHSNVVRINQRLCFGTANPYVAGMEARMNRTLQILIAVACVVVIACGAIFLMDRKEIADQAAADREWAAMVQRSKNEAFAKALSAREQTKVDACAAALDAYDSRNETFAFVERVKASGQVLTGDAMQAEVAACRDLIQSSKPSEQPE